MFVLCTHHDPDIDGVGATLALSIYLKEKGYEVLTILENFPEYMQFLNGRENISYLNELRDSDKFTIIALDCASKDRIWPKDISDRAERIVNIDHHSDNTKFGDINVVNSFVSSSAELLYNLFKVNNSELNLKICENIYAGILFDTGGFRYQNTNFETLLIGAELLQKGVNASRIAEYVFNIWSESGFRTLKIALKNLEYFKTGKILFSFVPYKEIVEEGLKSEDFEGIVDILRSNRNARIIILLREIEENLFKASLRSKGEISINQIARKFNGGGHPHAAGFEIKYTDVNTIKDKLIKELLELI